MAVGGEEEKESIMDAAILMNRVVALTDKN